MSTAGNFEIRVDTCRYPIRAILKYKGVELPIICHPYTELSDLKYAVEKAMQEARAALPERERGEV